MRYKITVERIEPHPKAGQVMPREYGVGYQQHENHYPETTAMQVLNAELSQMEYRACKLAIIEAVE